jgi:hypothetical protein
MMESEVVFSDDTTKVVGRKVGWVVGAIITAVVLWVMNQLLVWEWPSWLTDEFAEVLPAIRNSLIASIVVYLLYVFYDAPWFRALGDLVTGWFSLVAGWTMWQVFPLDFSAYAFDWALVARVVMGLGIFGIIVSMIANVVKFLKAVSGRGAGAVS